MICITGLSCIFKSCLERTPGVLDMPSIMVSLLKGSLQTLFDKIMSFHLTVKKMQ